MDTHKAIDTTNHFGVGTQGNDLVILTPPRRPITPDQALVLAAWLVSIAESDASFSFEEALQAVKET